MGTIDIFLIFATFIPVAFEPGIGFIESTPRNTIDRIPRNRRGAIIIGNFAQIYTTNLKFEKSGNEKVLVVPCHSHYTLGSPEHNNGRRPFI